MGDTFNFVQLSLAILLFSDKSQAPTSIKDITIKSSGSIGREVYNPLPNVSGMENTCVKSRKGLIFERLLCENSDAELNCPVGNVIDDINITFHDIPDACSLNDDVYNGIMASNSIYHPSCIGHTSCVLTDTMVNFTHTVVDRTKKIYIKYDCVRDINRKKNSRSPKTVCPFNMESVACGSSLRKIEIQSVELLHYVSFCEKQTLDKNCTELVHQRINISCNGKQRCQQLIWNESVSTWDDCIRILKFVNISFSCKAIPPNVPLTDETHVVSVAVGVTFGFITIIGVVVVYVWFVRRKVTDDKQNISNQRDENKYSIGNENSTIPADSNYEMLTTDKESRSYDEVNQDFRKQSRRDQPDRNNKDIENEYIIPCPVTKNNKYKHANKDQTVNHVETNIGTGIREDTKTSLSNSANYFIVLESNGTDHPVHHLNSNIYEMANPINENEMDN